uniref:Reverse transcriptase/retrotransposon-derived protein RNase H-like domain-containing protein n=1 Tax=Fagus sylvatica TaxID=28930 RepID=A0A2N9HKG4_FAGSY
MRRSKMEPWNSLKRNKSDVDMDEPAAVSTAMTPVAIRTLQRNPKFCSLFNQLGLNPEARTAATEAIMAIAAESGAHYFTAETHANRAFLETTNTITFTDEDMEHHPSSRNISEEDPMSTYGDKIFGGMGEYTKGHIQLVLKVGPIVALTRFHVVDSVVPYHILLGKPWLHKHQLVSSTYHQCVKGRLNRKPIRIAANPTPFDQSESHFVEAALYDEVAPVGEASLAKPVEIPLPKWEEIKDTPEANLRDLLELKRKHREEASTSKMNEANGPESADAATGESAAPDPKIFAKEELEDAEKTAFRTPIRNFYYTVMPFGLKNARATYQRTMTAMFHDMMHHEIEDYVNDVVVKSKTREDHFGILKKVFERCRLYKLKMNPLKCTFGVLTGKFLGFLVHQRGIDVDPARASAIATMKPPTTHKELKSFLGKLSYIRRFIPGLATVTFAFSPLLKKEAPFHWSTECQQAFKKVQDIMTKLPTVCAPIFGKPLRLYLASNNQAIGALIAQEDDSGVEQPIYYVSRALKDAESRYSGAEQSCLALIYASQQLRHYFLAHQVQLMTKSHPIRSLLQRPVLSGKLAQWLLQLSQYEIINETGVTSQNISHYL